MMDRRVEDIDIAAEMNRIGIAARDAAAELAFVVLVCFDLFDDFVQALVDACVGFVICQQKKRGAAVL